MSLLLGLNHSLNPEDPTHQQPLHLSDAARRLGTYVIGTTGTGKSTFLQSLILQDIRAGYGVCVLDPHGDLVSHIRTIIPEARQKDLIYFDPSDDESAIPFNILKDTATHPHLIVSGIVGAFKKVWNDSWGPRLEHILRHSLMALVSVPEATLADLPRLLTDKRHRERVLWYATDPQVKSFFKQEYEKYTPRFQQEAIAPILNKVGQFLANPLLKRVLVQPEDRLRIREAMDEGRIVLMNLSKGKIGEDGSALLGTLLLAQIERAALSRADISADARRPFYLYVDEFANFATPSFVGMLSEARKYGLSLTLAMQSIQMIDEDIRSAVFGNVGMLLAFQASAEDALYLEREFTPEFKAHDFVSLPRYHVYIKMMVEGEVSRPFSAVTLAPISG